jgi:hypothetical protein
LQINFQTQSRQEIAKDTKKDYNDPYFLSSCALSALCDLVLRVFLQLRCAGNLKYEKHLADIKYIFFDRVSRIFSGTESLQSF